MFIFANSSYRPNDILISNSNQSLYLDMALKYQAEIDKLPCDMQGFGEQNNRDSYRWVFEDITLPKNFLPVFLLDDRERVNCKGWALSLFSTQEKAKKRLLRLTKNKPLLYQKLGNCIAKGSLMKEHGVSDEAADNGHFSLFEYEKVDLHKEFTIIEKLKITDAGV